MPQFDPSTFPSQIFWLIVTFALVFIVAARIALPRVGEVLDNRRSRVDNDLARARELTEEAEEVLSAYEQELASARDKAKEALAEAAASAAKASEERNDALTARLATESRAAQTRIAEARDAATASIGEVATEIAVEATDRLIGVRPASDSAAGAVDAVIKERS
jgi:F-type H+-transporting ATPase subunit b